MLTHPKFYVNTLNKGGSRTNILKFTGLNCGKIPSCVFWLTQLEFKLLSKILFVGLGGFVGATLRYLTSGFVGRLTSTSSFPYGTFVVNMVGCLLIGFLAGVADTRAWFTTTSRAFVFTGVLGAFTTFSTFSYETMGLFQNGQTTPALTNVGLQIILGLVSVWGGLQLARLV
jgi:fluoride exporter